MTHNHVIPAAVFAGQESMAAILTAADDYCAPAAGPEWSRAIMDVVESDTEQFREAWLYSDARAGLRIPSVVARDLHRLEASDLLRCGPAFQAGKLSNGSQGENELKFACKIDHARSTPPAEPVKDAETRRFIRFCSPIDVSLPVYANRAFIPTKMMERLPEIRQINNELYRCPQ